MKAGLAVTHDLGDAKLTLMRARRPACGADFRTLPSDITSNDRAERFRRRTTYFRTVPSIIDSSSELRALAARSAPGESRPTAHRARAIVGAGMKPTRASRKIFAPCPPQHHSSISTSRSDSPVSCASTAERAFAACHAFGAKGLPAEAFACWRPTV